MPIDAFVIWRVALSDTRIGALVRFSSFAPSFESGNPLRRKEK